MSIFIGIEGGEMVGKTSIVAPIYGVLKSAGYEVIKSREPGGTPEAEVIRRDIFKALRENVGAEELAIMFFKARKLHLDQVLIPHLGKNKEKNTIALIDRYASTTRVLQGAEGGVPQIRLRQMEDEYAHNFFPDLTILMYFPENIFEKTFLERKKFAEAAEPGSRSNTLWDEGDVELQLMRQRHYLNLPVFYRETGVNLNFETLDASRPIEVVTKDALGIISRIIKEKSVTGKVPPEQLVSLYEAQKRR